MCGLLPEGSAGQLRVRLLRQRRVLLGLPRPVRRGRSEEVQGLRRREMYRQVQRHQIHAAVRVLLQRRRMQQSGVFGRLR